MKNINKYKINGFRAYIEQYGRDNELNIDRSKIIGSSDIGSIMEVNPYCSAYKLFLEKTGVLPNTFDNDKKKKLAIGKMMEDFIINCYLNIHGIEYDNIQRDVRITKDSFTAQADAIIEDTIIEVKNIERFYGQYTDSGELKIPEYYKYQMFWQMYLFGIKKAKLVVYNNSEQQLYELPLDYPSQEEIAIMIAKAHHFLKALIDKNVDMVKPKSIEDMILINSKNVGINYLPVKQFYDDLLVLNTQLKDIENKISNCKKNIILYMGEHDSLLKDGKTILTYKTQITNRLNTESIKENHSDIYNDNIKQIKTRVFKLANAKESKEEQSSLF